MYITTDLLIKIALIIYAVVNLIFNIVLLIKLRGAKNTTSTTVTAVMDKAKSIGSKVIELIEPQFPNIVRVIRTITGAEAKFDEDNKEVE